MIPVVDDLKSSVMVHRHGDLFNPPGLTNFLGCAQADLDPVAIRSLNFPPFSCSDTVTAALFLNGVYFPATGAAVSTTWFPDRIEREATVDGLYIKTITAMAVGKMATMVQICVENRSGHARDVSLKLAIRGNIGKFVSPWTEAVPPCEADNLIDADKQRGAILFSSRKKHAFNLQGIYPAGQITLTPAQLRTSFSLGAGEKKTVSYVHAIGQTLQDVQRTYDSLICNVASEIEKTRDDWNRELRALFTPNNDRYSGYLPTLNTSDKEILRLYHMAIVGVVYFKRDTPFSVYGRAYTVLAPRYWQPLTFLWDYSLSSMVHALLDPAVMRKYLELWMHMDIHKHFGTEFLTGAGVGPWYSVNDYAMTTIARDYLRFTGDRNWLDQSIDARGESRRVIEYLQHYATNWQQFKTKSGLADYGGLNNLLECVNTYLHEVASLNAANVFSMRTVAEILEMRGRGKDAQRLRDDAHALVSEVQKLYVRGKGFWNARFPDGSMREVRHVYDFLTTLNTIAEDLSTQQTQEMTAFFKRELQTPTWMRALSAHDDDAVFSNRPDHQWNGAYTAWPALCVTGLYRIGETDLAFNWLKGLSRSANQGPFGQAHFVENVFAPEDGGAIKAPSDIPYINDWLCASNGAWVNCIIESIFGVRASIDGKVEATPQFASFDPNATLENLCIQGTRYHVSRKKIMKAD